ncbi:hypothetical protein DSO57_1022934 [Entomophthora muscae]|uniref:Uncharacterized protein n=1 Tax=Entomophthora muscae TaxID=34485 RepID=A0ACC2UNR6_9FUNG|nr:hypothetical protein DSO57_1022934 [Entomophthora muscae]
MFRATSGSKLTSLRQYHINRSNHLSGPRPLKIFINESGILLVQLRSLLGGYFDYDNLIQVNEILYSVQKDAKKDKRISSIGFVLSPLAEESCDLELEASRFYFPIRQNLTNYMTTFLFILFRLHAITIPKVCGIQAENADLASLFFLKSFDDCFVIHSRDKHSRVSLSNKSCLNLLLKTDMAPVIFGGKAYNFLMDKVHHNSFSFPFSMATDYDLFQPISKDSIKNHDDSPLHRFDETKGTFCSPLSQEVYRRCLVSNEKRLESFGWDFTPRGASLETKVSPPLSRGEMKQPLALESFLKFFSKKVASPSSQDYWRLKAGLEFNRHLEAKRQAFSLP